MTFLLSLPALFLPTNRGWLRAQGWLVVFCATFTLALGVTIWVETLQTRSALSVMWAREVPLKQSLLQQRVSLAILHSTLARLPNPPWNACAYGCSAARAEAEPPFLNHVWAMLFRRRH